MAGLRDLSPCTYLPLAAEHLLAVGWLEQSLPFPTGRTPANVFSRLQEFVRQPWQPFVWMGIHCCGLCQFEGEKTGTANLFVPHQGKIYVCPELITHYINAHFYRPPDVFCEAVLACPDMKSMEYKRLLIACEGRVLWENSNRSEIPERGRAPGQPRSD